MWKRRGEKMTELISKSAIEKITLEYAKSVTSENSQQEMIKMVSNIIYKCINSIDKKAISEIVSPSTTMGLNCNFPL
jgi:hypothetical protein